MHMRLPSRDLLRADVAATSYTLDGGAELSYRR